jgi:hypothetical protein
VLGFRQAHRRAAMVTSKKEASKAGADLRNPKTPEQDRGPIAAALAQAAKKGRVVKVKGKRKHARKGPTRKTSRR